MKNLLRARHSRLHCISFQRGAALGALLLAGAVNACTSSQADPAAGGNKVLGGQTGDEFDQVMQRVVGNEERRGIEGPAAGAASASLSEFAWSFYAASSDPVENFVYSPYSITTAASMLYAGAGGETQAQMAEVFKFSPEGPAFHQAANNLMQHLVSRNVDATEERNAQSLRISNDFWMAQRLAPRASFLDTLSSFYGAPAFLFEGTPEMVRQAINSKVASDTEDLITELLPPDSIQQDTVFVMTNALYFKSRWHWEFSPSRTEKTEFQLDDGTTAEVDMMHSPDFDFGYRELDGVEVLAMPYSGKEIEFVAMMPPAGEFESFAAGLTPTRVEELATALPSTVLNLRFPKMNLETEVPLKAELQDLGMSDAWLESEANFEPLTEAQIWLGAAFHQTKMILDEEGTSAAAATAFVAVDESVPPMPLEVTYNRPFVFMIRDIESQAVLFMGHYVNP